MVETPIGGRVRLDRICRGCDLTILDRAFTFNFIVMDMATFDVILGMDWLFHFRATIDCYRRRVCLCTPEGDCFYFTGDRCRVFDPSVADRRVRNSVTYMLASLTLTDDSAL